MHSRMDMEHAMSILSWLGRSRPQPTPAEAPTQGFHSPLSPRELLNTPRRQQLLENIWHRASLSRSQFDLLYRRPLERFADLVQLLPASENHHHAHLGGLLDHGLEIVAYALKIRQTFLLPIGAPPESQSAQAEAWSAAAAYGALLHDLGKIAVDVHVELQGGQAWHPWHGNITKPYRFQYVKGREYHLHGAATALIYTHILDAEILDWLSGFPELWKQLIYLLAGQYDRAGILAEIVIKADSASVAQELGGNPDRALAAPKQSLQRQLADALRHLVRDKFKLNQPDGPSDGWLTQDALWLVSKPTADQLRAALLSQGIEGIPSSNAPFFNMLQDQAIVQSSAQDKAVWRASIDNGQGWQVSGFTLLKVSPSLIWSEAKDRPEAYSGRLTVEDEPMEQSGAKETACDVPLEPQQAPAAEVPSPNTALPQSPASNNRPFEEDDLLTLFDNINRPSQDQTENSSPATPPEHPRHPPRTEPYKRASRTNHGRIHTNVH